MNIIVSPYRIEDIEKLKAAGANSVIVGTPFYSVRSVTHLNEDELKQVRQICTDLNIEMYVLVNRLCIEKEIDGLRQHLKMLKEINVDGIYFSDMGVFYEASMLDIQDKMIYNPDTILTNANDIQAYLDLGMKSVTISKEITLENIVLIGNKVHGNCELIVHGRLNMMHSKRTLLTNYMQFLKKDINLRNKQDLYLMEENREEHMPIVEDEHGTHIYTGFTLCSFEELEDIIKANIRNIRIESMFMNIDELCNCVKDYVYVSEHPEKGREMFKKYETEYPEMNITKGFLYKKTGLLK